MTVAHTPGPWIRKGEQVCNHHEVMYCAAANFDCIMPSQTLEANARLIAAAPTLLETLRLLELQLAMPYAPDSTTVRSKAEQNQLVRDGLGLVLQVIGLQGA